eukprot:gene6812-7343_t
MQQSHQNSPHQAEIRLSDEHKRPKVSYYVTAGIFSLGVLYFFSARLVEITESSFISPFNFTFLVVGNLAVGSLFITPPKTMILTIHRIGLIIMVVLLLKLEIETKLRENIPSRDLTGHVAIVTGGNTGIGFSSVKHLVAFNATVVMACRSMDKCHDAVKKIQAAYPDRADRVLPYRLDLSDLESVAQFTENFKKDFERLDILVNNAGLVCPSGRRTKQGFEELLGSMHIGHFALTKWLLDMLSKPIEGNDNVMNAARVVNVASGAFTMGAFHPSIFSESGEGDFNGEFTDNCQKKYGVFPCCPLSACPHTNGYARAKLANILHMQELQRRYDDYVYNYRQNHPEVKEDLPFRRIITSSLNPGTVSTNIASFLKYSFLFIRDIDDAAWVIMDAVFSNEYIPSSFLDTMKGKHDFISYGKYGLEKHLDNYPTLVNDLTVFPPNPSRAWERTKFIQPMIPELQDKSNLEIVHLLKVRLWDVTDTIVTNWEKSRFSVVKPPLIGRAAIRETTFTLAGLPNPYSNFVNVSNEGIEKREDFKATHTNDNEESESNVGASIQLSVAGEL